MFRLEIEIDVLDAQSIHSAMRDLQRVRTKMVQLMRNAVRRGAERIQANARQNIHGNLAQSIEIIRKDDAETAVVVTAPYGAYVEFGTGIVGETSPHYPDLPSSWEYEIGRTIDPITHRWTFKKEGKFYRTKGQPARGFMWRAFDEARQHLDELWETSDD